MKLLVTAGPTREPIDPARFISNRSSGKMGYAVAAAAVKNGHSVTLISGIGFDVLALGLPRNLRFMRKPARMSICASIGNREPNGNSDPQ